MNLRAAISLAAVLTPASAAYFALDNEELPIGKTGKKLVIEYQSAKSKESRTYRVRNTAKGILTPVLWKTDAEVFIDVNLPKCDKEKESCAWVETSIPSLMIDKGPTRLGYGVNKEEFVDKPDAFVRATASEECPSEEPSKEKKEKFRPLITTLKGTIADKTGKEYAINLTVRSEAKQNTEFVDLTYNLSITKGSIPILISEQEKEVYKDKPRLVWESADSEQFRKELARVKSRLLDEITSSIPIKINAKEEVVVRDKLLILWLGKEKLASVTAPAYVPK